MLTLKKIAVTGGLSCGKSSVCRIFKELGAYIISADEVVHQLLSPETSSGRQVIKLLGSDIVEQNRIDRAKIAKKVFKNPNLLQSLEQITHPAVRAEIEAQYRQACSEGRATLYVAEIPLFFESDLLSASGTYDYTIAIVADKQKCQERFTKSTGYDEEEYEKRMSRQLPPETKAEKADFVIYNNGSFEDLHRAVVDLYHKIVQ